MSHYTYTVVNLATPLMPPESKAKSRDALDCTAGLAMAFTATRDSTETSHFILTILDHLILDRVLDAGGTSASAQRHMGTRLRTTTGACIYACAHR
jgi:hypothetical protein